MAAIYEKLKMMREKAGLRQGQIADIGRIAINSRFMAKTLKGSNVG